MKRGRLLLLVLMLIGGSQFVGCGESKTELPTREKIQRQVERDAAMQAEEDRLEKEAAER
jgi:hypothetical protein